MAPDKVRLMTKPDDGYTWSYRSEVAHLFAKHLSVHTIPACEELCREVGKRFWAVPFVETKPSPRSSSASRALRCTSPPDEDADLPIDLDPDWELSLLKRKLKTETAEKERLREELHAANGERERLAKELQEVSCTADQRETLMFRCLAVMDQIASSIGETQKECVDSMDLSFFP